MRAAEWWRDYATDYYRLDECTSCHPRKRSKQGPCRVLFSARPFLLPAVIDVTLNGRAGAHPTPPPIRIFGMAARKDEMAEQWIAAWLASVADGSNTMSQRKLSSIETRGGGLRAVKALAKEKGVHLFLLEDDKGDEFVAASTKPFKVIC